MKQQRYTHERSQFGIEITNNTSERQSLNFLGMYHRHKFDKNKLQVKTIAGDTLFDDTDMIMLSNWIQSVGIVNIGMTVFQTSLLYGSFNGKQFGIKSHDAFGNIGQRNLALSRYRQQHEFKTNITQIHEVYIIAWQTELSMTNIEPGEILIIVFFINMVRRRQVLDMTPQWEHTNMRQEEANVDILLRDMEKKFGADKRKKLLLLI